MDYEKLAEETIIQVISISQENLFFYKVVFEIVKTPHHVGLKGLRFHAYPHNQRIATVYTAGKDELKEELKRYYENNFIEEGMTF